MYEAVYFKDAKTFVLRFFNKPGDADVTKGFVEFEALIEANYDRSKFGLVINVTEEAHYSFSILKRIRLNLMNLHRREFIGAMCAVNELQEKVDFRNGIDADKLMPFFTSEDEALLYCKGKVY